MEDPPIENEQKTEEEKRKRDIFSQLDNIDEERREKSRLETIRVSGKERREKEVLQEKRKEMVIGKGDDLTIIEIQTLIDGLQGLKQSHVVKGNYLDAIKITEKLIDFASENHMTHTVEKERESLEILRSKINDEPYKIDIPDQIDGLRGLKQGHVVKEEHEKAINIANKIINLAKGAKLKRIIKEEEKFIGEIRKKMSVRLSNVDTMNKIEGLRELKQTHVVNKEYPKAINYAQKIIKVAKKSKLKSIINEEENSITIIQEKIKQKPLKMDTVDQIDGLKNVKQGHIVRGEHDKAISVAKKIIFLAKSIDMISLAREEEDSIDFLLSKKRVIHDLEGDTQHFNEEFDSLIEQNKVDEAQELITQFKKKFKVHPNQHLIQELVSSKNNAILSQKVKFKKEIIQQKEGNEVQKEKAEINEVVKSHEDVKAVLGAKKGDQIEYAILKAKQRELDSERAELEVVKENFEQVKIVLKEQKKNLESEYALFNAKQREFEEVKKSYEQVKAVLETQKINLEQEFQKLDSERAELEEIKENFEQVKIVLEEQKMNLESEYSKLNLEKSEFEATKKSHEDVKIVLEEQKMNLEGEFAKLNSERAQLEEKKLEFNDVIDRIRSEKKELQDKMLELEVERKEFEEKKEKLKKIFD